MSKTTQTEIEVGGTEVAAREAPAVNVERLMELALEKGTDAVEAFERLVELQERTEDRHAQRMLTAALNDFQAECPPVPKLSDAKIITKKGGSYGFKFARLDTIMVHIGPHLKAHGLTVSFDSEMVERMLSVTCRVTHSAGASVSSRFTCPIDTEAAMSGPQKAGAALTYAKRQAIASALGLVITNADADAQMAGDLTPISDAELRELQQLVQAKDVDIDRFLAYVGVESLKDIPAANFGMAQRTLMAKPDR